MVWRALIRNPGWVLCRQSKLPAKISPVWYLETTDCPWDLHAERALTKELVQGFDLIVVMDTINEAHLLARYPEAASEGRWLGAFARTYRLDFGETALRMRLASTSMPA